MMGITGAFSSLGINETSRNTRDKYNENKRVSKNYNSTSLPNLVSSNLSCIRNTYSSCDDEIDSSDPPIDFSKKYAETKISTDASQTEPNGSGTYNKVVKGYNSFTMYAETDLDQPTDYSLRYAEDDSESEDCNKIVKTEFVHDTIKTYCTEDTPYETPFNFSTSTSMSDLRIDDKKLTNENKHTNADTKPTSSAKLKSGFSSGIMSPEKPVNYCDEGTPGYFSRVDSCGSLNLIAVNESPKPKEEIVVKEKETRSTKFSSEAKAVKFEEVVNYAEETPLMFSRSSSLASLDSIEQHSINDDRSSVVSDFSRLTSGVISPSELPDSPTQTVPPSPKSHQNAIGFPTVVKKKKDVCRNTEQLLGPKSSVFEDDLKKFKMESTPLEFSTATSLSSLMLDDCDENVAESNQLPKVENGALTENETELDNLDINNDLSDSSEDEEDILAACINIGMQNNRYSQPKSSTPPPIDSLSSYFPHNSDGSSINSSSRSVQGSNTVIKNVAVLKIDITSDSLQTYCTEDTPAILSHAGSQSDLSVLSLVGNDGKLLNDTCLSIEEDEENILNSQIDKTIKPMEKTNEKVFSSFLSLNQEQPSTSKLVSVLEDSKPSISREIQYGSLANNSRTHFSLNHDSVRNYYTEDTPAVLSHAGSQSDLSILSLPGNDNDNENEIIKDYFSDLNSTVSDEDDDELLNECVRFGMAKTTATPNINTPIISKKGPKKDVVINNYLCAAPSASGVKLKVDLNISLESNASSDDDSSVSSISEDSYESEQALLQECILAGMPKPSQPPKNNSSPPPPDRKESNDLSLAEKALLQQCILEGMQKCSIKSKKLEDDDSSELTAAEKALLRQCILAGMPKNKNLTLGGPSASRESTELSGSERLLLQQCILAGMPKNKSNASKLVNPVVQSKTKVLSKRSKESERGSGSSQGGEHNCCVHCPRNQKNGGHKQGNVRVRRKSRSHEKSQLRENNRDILYVTNQLMKKDRSHEEWI